MEKHLKTRTQIRKVCCRMSVFNMQSFSTEEECLEYSKEMETKGLGEKKYCFITVHCTTVASQNGVCRTQ
jgi:hypothetical protein